MATLEFGTGNATNYTTLFTVELDTRGMDAVTLADTCLKHARLHLADVTSVTPTKAAIAGKNGRVYVHLAQAPKQAQSGKQAPASKAPAAAPVMPADFEAAMLVEYGVAPDMDTAKQMVAAKREARKAEVLALQESVDTLNARIAELQAELASTVAARDADLARIADLARKA